MAKKAKGLSPLIAVVAIGILALVAGLIYSRLRPEAVFNREGAGLVVYENEEAGFKLQYPGNWEVEEEALTNPDSDSQTLSVTISSPESRSSAWALITQEQCTQENQDFQRLIDEPPYILSKVVCRDNFRIALSVFENDPKEEAYKETLNQMLSTFEFVE